MSDASIAGQGLVSPGVLLDTMDASMPIRRTKMKIQTQGGSYEIILDGKNTGFVYYNLGRIPGIRIRPYETAGAYKSYRH